MGSKPGEWSSEIAVGLEVSEQTEVVRFADVVGD